MSTRSSANWQSQPGYIDSLHLNERFPASNRWGIAQLTRLTMRHLPDTLIAYGYRARPKEPFKVPATHFFLDDYRFESVWRNPRKSLPKVQKYPVVLTPDFSLYRDYPLASQLWNVYRNRWCGAYWQQQGLWVIPTVSWSSAESYPFCFLGIPKGSVVAVSTVGVKWRTDMLAYTLFVNGFQEMVERIEPVAVIAYGSLPPICDELTAVIERPTHWQSLRQPNNQVRH
jgi:hypothetical protein